MRKIKAHCSVVAVVSVPAAKRSREQKARLHSVKPRLDSFCYAEMYRRHVG